MNTGMRIIDDGKLGTIVATPEELKYNMYRVIFDDGAIVNYAADEWADDVESGIIAPAPALPAKYNHDA